MKKSTIYLSLITLVSLFFLAACGNSADKDTKESSSVSSSSKASSSNKEESSASSESGKAKVKVNGGQNGGNVNVETDDAKVEANGDGSATVEAGNENANSNGNVNVNEDGVHVQGGGVDVKVGSDGTVNVQTPELQSYFEHYNIKKAKHCLVFLIVHFILRSEPKRLTEH